MCMYQFPWRAEQCDTDSVMWRTQSKPTMEEKRKLLPSLDCLYPITLCIIRLKTHRVSTSALFYHLSVVEDKLGISVVVPFSQVNGLKLLYITHMILQTYPDINYVLVRGECCPVKSASAQGWTPRWPLFALSPCCPESRHHTWLHQCCTLEMSSHSESESQSE